MPLCTAIIPWGDLAQSGKPNLDDISIEVVTDDGVAFALTFTRSRWSKLVRGAQEVEAHMQPLPLTEKQVA